ncbi:hypothetical protein CgunFtcFv8_006173 [Champsocephalus gunnari]|uniref:Uncharacterized protein n=1 Tax=Champsocephalus gunnari TaxID=52237 RepID=A0AAN8GVU0_CHAGU|nr:hypothetical protein CgunFtcFv8_006173 [Champsocephalus gunnari]
MKMSAAVKMVLSLLLTLHLSRAQKPSDSPSMLSTAGHQSPVSLLLLILTVVMSSCIYVWVLRFVCIVCCQPVAVGCESDALADMV